MVILRERKTIRILYLTVALAAAVWTIFIFTTLRYHYLDFRKHITGLAHEAASESLQKDVLYRYWAAGHGGVYVPVSPTTPPNPYLSHIPERDIVTPSGRKLTLVNPAYMTRQVHELGRLHFGNLAHITSSNPLNPMNAPDPWEKKALAAIEKGVEEFGEVVTLGNASYYRLMIPLWIEDSCLQCHKQQGYHLGDLRGGLTSSVPMKDYEAVLGGHLKGEMTHFGSSWLVGLLIMAGALPFVHRRIAERDRASSALAESEDRYRMLFHANPHPMWVYDRTTMAFLMVNDAAIEKYGYSRQEFLERTILDIRPAEDVQAIREFVDRRMKDYAFSGPWRHRKKDGSLLTVEISSHLLEWDGRSAVLVSVNDISDRLISEQALQESEERYRTIVNTAQEGIVVINEKGEIDFINDRFADLLGYLPQELIGRHILSLVHEDERKEHEKQLEMQKTGQASSYDRRFRRKNGTVLWTIASASPLLGRNGAYRGAFGMFTDITERKRAEDALRESEGRLRTIFDASRAGIVLVNPQGTITFANQRMAEMFKLQLSALIGTPYPSYLHPEQREEGRERMVKMLSGEADSIAVERRYVASDGTDFYGFLSGRRLEDERGRLVCLVGIIADITERKKVEEALLASEGRYRSLFEQSRDAIFMLEAEGPTAGRIVSANKTALDMHGYTDQDMSRLQMQDLLPPEDAKAFPERLRQIDREGRLRYEALHRRKNGSDFILEVTETLIMIGGRHYCMSVGRDSSDLKRSEEQRRTLEEQLIQVQKIEALGRLAGGVAHDINNMLMPIMGYANILLESLPAGDSRREEAEAIIRSAERVRDIARQLLAFARKQTLEMKVLDLHEVVARFEKMLRRTIRENVVIETRYAPDLPPIKGDPGQIEQVILNLAVNAQDAMPGGGTLLIDTKHVLLDQAFVDEHKGAHEGDYLSIAVTDNGTGMNRDVQSLIFEPFFTTKERGRGTGLGLAMVYGIVKQHGGYVDVASEIGKGTTFTIYFPVTTETPGAAEEPDGPVLASSHRETILVVEDQKEVLAIVSMMLREYGYRVLQASTPEAALALLQQSEQTVDLLVADVIMPGMDGTEVFLQLSSACPGLKVLYMSGYPDDVISTHGVLRSGINFIQKPFSPASLVKKVRIVLSQAEPPAAGSGQE